MDIYIKLGMHAFARIIDGIRESPKAAGARATPAWCAPAALAYHSHNRIYPLQRLTFAAVVENGLLQKIRTDSICPDCRCYQTPLGLSLQK